MKLFIAEKPKQAAEIAGVIGIAGRDDGCLRLKDGSVFTWLTGHMLEQLMPDEYDDRWKPWRWDTLPIAPSEWKLKEVSSKKKQLRVVKDLLKKTKEVVICTDAGREGELIAREVLEFYKYKGKITRLWLSTLLEEDIRKALGSLLAGDATYPMYQAALARSRADWLYGMNLSRAAAMASGDQMSVGRVQTPTLAMVVKRDLEIANFVPRTYYTITATVNTEEGHTLTLEHAPAEDKRIYDENVASQLMAQAEGAEGPLSVSHKKGTEGPKQPFSIGTLQQEASKLYQFNAEKTLKIAQSLYEKKATSYPRTDCPYLPEALKAEVPDIIRAVGAVLPSQVNLFMSWKPVFRTTVFNDKKLSDHHGIVPTRDSRAVANLSSDEMLIYTLVAVRFMQSMGPDMRFDLTKVTMDANGVLFSANGRIITDKGWRALSHG